MFTISDRVGRPFSYLTPVKGLFQKRVGEIVYIPFKIKQQTTNLNLHLSLKYYSVYNMLLYFIV